MTPATIPANDADRLAALRALLILDTPPEARFDRIVAFVAQEFDVPISLVSLVDESRQWFKARRGMDCTELPRATSFCGHAILSREVFIVPDALQDTRFADNPFVTGPEQIRFYAGAPLVLPSGHVAGTLCLLDRKPRSLDAIDLAILVALRDLCVEELTRRAGEASPLTDAPHA